MKVLVIEDDSLVSDLLETVISGLFVGVQVLAGFFQLWVDLIRGQGYRSLPFAYRNFCQCGPH